MNKSLRFLSVLLTGFVSLQSARAVITFIPGNYYSSNYSSRTITEYGPAGNVVGSLTLPASAGSEIRGIAFGPDGLLYATEVRGFGFAVVALNSSGAIQQTYLMSSDYLGGDISYGKLAVDSQHIFVAGGLVTSFDVGNPNSGKSIYTDHQVQDVEILPSGHLLIGSALGIDEITNMGTYVRSLASQGVFFEYIPGVEYDSANNKIFASEFGSSNYNDRILRINGSTGALEKSIDLANPKDLFLTQSGNLLVGSYTESPRLYNEDLVQVGTLNGGPQVFVTQYVIPEPGTAFLGLGILAAALLECGRRIRHVCSKNSAK